PPAPAVGYGAGAARLAPTCAAPRPLAGRGRSEVQLCRGREAAPDRERWQPRAPLSWSARKELSAPYLLVPDQSNSPRLTSYRPSSQRSAVSATDSADGAGALGEIRAIPAPSGVGCQAWLTLRSRCLTETCWRRRSRWRWPR